MHVRRARQAERVARLRGRRQQAGGRLHQAQRQRQAGMVFHAGDELGAHLEALEAAQGIGQQWLRFGHVLLQQRQAAQCSQRFGLAAAVCRFVAALQ